MTANLTPSKVFVPGGMPVITYIPRAERELETQLRSVEDNLCKLVTLTGATKSGKTVLANRIFPRSSGLSIWIDGGGIDTEETFWREIHAAINPDEELDTERSDLSENVVDGKLGAEGGYAPLRKGKSRRGVFSQRWIWSYPKNTASSGN